jgi:hypothetical protein
MNCETGHINSKPRNPSDINMRSLGKAQETGTGIIGGLKIFSIKFMNHISPELWK